MNSKNKKDEIHMPNAKNVKVEHTANESPKKDKDGNSLVPGVYSDSDPIGGG